MNTGDVINALLRIPRRFYELGNVVFMTLLEESGYCAMPDQITESAIRDALNKQPEFMRDWQILSEDKRTSGWYWQRNPNGGYEVTYISEVTWTDTEVLSYSDEASACAAFIKREIEGVRDRAKGSAS